MKPIVFAPLLLLLFISLSAQSQNDADIQYSRKVKLKMVYKLEVDGFLSRARITVLLPKNIKNRQDVQEISYSQEPDSIYNHEENRYALYKFYDLEKDQKITIEAGIIIYKYIAGNNTDTAENLARWLLAEPNIESKSPEIKKVAATLKKKYDVETVVATYQYVNENIRYKVGDPQGAAGVLGSGIGKCMDFSDLFVALCRANGIPAKYVAGALVNGDKVNALHAWSEAWLPQNGWILFDPTTTHSGIRQEGINYKIKLSNKYIILTSQRNDSQMYGSSLLHYWWQGNQGSRLHIKLISTAIPL